MIKQILKRFTFGIIIFSLITGMQDVTISYWSTPFTDSDTGMTLKTAHAQKKKGKKRSKRVKKFALNFKDVEIDEFLNIMSQLIGKNIILDDKIRGKISISSARKVPVSQAYAIMKSILEVKGLAVVESGNLIKVLPIKDAIKKNVEIIVDGKKKLVPIEDKTVTFLLELKTADATEVSRALKPLKSKFTDIVTYQPLNTLIFSGNSTEINGLVTIATALDKQVEEKGKDALPSKGNIHVIHLENADATQLAEVLSRIPFSETAKINTTPLSTSKVRTSSKSKRIVKRQPISSKKASKLSIIANKDTNSLIITATPPEFKQIKRIIKELDIVREQVLIEALIIEVNAENGWGFGIDWMLGQQAGVHLFGGSQVLSNISPTSFGQTVNGKKIALPLSSGFQLGYMPDTSILGFALLNATGTDKNFNILSTPQILTVDNQEAELNVGEEIPVASNNRISESGTQFYTYEYKSVGIKLKITPHITNKKRITLDLYQEINSVLTNTTVLATGATVPPTLGKRDIKTKVTVMDGKTIVVGGLIQNKKTEEEIKVPVLGDIPILGWLFKNKTVSYKKTNLLIFITPHIVTKQERIDAVTRQKRESLDRLRRK